jgi:hypothetical protein
MSDKVTARIVADVAPEVKVKLREVSTAKGLTMAQYITIAIEAEHEKMFGKVKKEAAVK